MILTEKTLPKKIECFLPPTVMYGPATRIRYAIIAGKWHECDDTVTHELLQDRWLRPKLQKAEKKPANEVEVKVKSSSGKDYYIVRFQQGYWSCSCPSFGFRRKCKHIDQVKTKKH